MNKKDRKAPVFVTTFNCGHEVAPESSCDWKRQAQKKKSSFMCEMRLMFQLIKMNNFKENDFHQ